jgi:hypothetical protein
VNGPFTRAFGLFKATSKLRPATEKSPGRFCVLAHDFGHNHFDANALIIGT